jgi:hypothetical protein
MSQIPQLMNGNRLQHDAVSDKGWYSRSPGSHCQIFEDFFGVGALPTTAHTGFVSHDGDGGTSEHVFSDEACGAYKLLTTNHASVKEIAVMGNAVIRGDKKPVFEARVSITGTPHADDIIIIGLVDERHDTVDTISHAAIFRMEGANQNILVETDDGTNTLDDQDTGSDWVSTTYYKFKIDMSDLSNVLFFIDDVNVTPTTMSLADMGSTLLLPIVEVQCSSGEVAQANVDYISVVWER